MNGPDVSVVVCTHNRARLLKGALESLAGQQTGGAFSLEVLVVDNASTDETPEVVERLAAQISVPLRRVYESRKGIATARNRGVAEARGAWIAFFDDDQLADPQWLYELLATASVQHARCVGGKVELMLPNSVDQAAGLVSNAGSVAHAGQAAGLPVAGTGSVGDDRRRLAPMCRLLLGGTVGPDRHRRYNHRVTPGTGNLLVHRSVFEEIGVFNEDFNQRGEDTDLFLRMLAAGIEGWFTPRAVVHHLIPPERLADAWFLKTAWRTAEGMADDERRAWGGLAFPLIYAARLVQALAVLLPRWMIAGLLRDRERLLATRCRGVIARRFLHDGWRLIVPDRVRTAIADSGRVLNLAGRGIRRVFHSGPLDTARWAWFHAEERFWERRLGIETVDSEADSQSPGADCVAYEPISYRCIRIGLANLEIDPSCEVILDYGCGKGRFLALAATRPFRRVLGVELQPRLARSAEENLHRARSRNLLRAREVEVVTADATMWRVPADVTVVHLFNPFTGRVLAEVLERLRESLVARPRRLRVLYLRPDNVPDGLAGCDWLERVRDLPAGPWQAVRFSLYESCDDVPGDDDSRQTADAGAGVLVGAAAGI